MIPITRPSTRLRLFNALVDAGCELLALASDAGRSLVASREPDALADRHVEEIDALAQRQAEEAAAGILTYERAFQYALLVRRHCDGYRRADAAEDGLIGAASGVIARIVALVQGLNRALERELARRRRTGARP